MSNKKLASFALMLLLSLAGCAIPQNGETPPQNTDTKEESPLPSSDEDRIGWKTVDTGVFTLSLPSGWKFNKLQGIDSYIGELVGDNMVLQLDAGGFAGSITDENDPDHVINYETIDGKRARIVTPKIPGQGMTGVYIGTQNNIGSDPGKLEITNSDDISNFSLTGNNLTVAQQEMALKAFRTIQMNENFKPFS